MRWFVVFSFRYHPLLIMSWHRSFFTLPFSTRDWSFNCTATASMAVKYSLRYVGIFTLEIMQIECSIDTKRKICRAKVFVWMLTFPIGRHRESTPHGFERLYQWWWWDRNELVVSLLENSLRWTCPHFWRFVTDWIHKIDLNKTTFWSGFCYALFIILLV